jgi:hypothetical protein
VELDLAARVQGVDQLDRGDPAVGQVAGQRPAGLEPLVLDAQQAEAVAGQEPAQVGRDLGQLRVDRRVVGPKSVT